MKIAQGHINQDVLSAKASSAETDPRLKSEQTEVSNWGHSFKQSKLSLSYTELTELTELTEPQTQLLDSLSC